MAPDPAASASPSSVAAHDWHGAAAELTMLLQRYPIRKAAPEHNTDHSPTATPPWETYLARIDSLRAAWHSANASSNFWSGWRDLVALYAALAERIPVTSRWRGLRSTTFERIAWCYHQAFLWCWKAAEAIPEALWHGLYTLWEACVRQRIAWRRVVDPLTAEGKASPHELIGAVFLTYLVDPERMPPTTFARLLPVISENAPFLQLVPERWLSEGSLPFYGFSAHAWHSPRHPTDVTRTADPMWVIDLEALRLALQQGASAGENVAADSAALHTSRDWQALLALINQRPAARSEPRQDAPREAVRLVTGWEAITRHFSGMGTTDPPRAEGSLVTSHRIHLFGGWESDTSVNGDLAPDETWTVWDKSPSGWQLVRTVREAESLPSVIPQQLAALIWPGSAGRRAEPLLTRIRWRNRAGQLLRIGVQRFPYLQIQGISARPWTQPGEPAQPWSPTFLLTNEGGAQSLVLPCPATARLLLHWEVRFEPQTAVPVLIEETFERGADYCWVSYRTL